MDHNHILDMLRMQDKSNSVVNPKWRYAGNDWLLAVMVESIEGIEHFGWKWWKKQIPDMDQVRMELVDIWHFALSHAIEMNPEPLERLAFKLHDIVSAFPIPKGSEIINADPSIFLRRVLTHAAQGDFAYFDFGSALAHSGMDWDDLYRLYMAKNILNDFRQSHGYKEGTYQKIWDGREDNEHLTELLDQCVHGVEGLEQKLEERYASIQKQN